MNEPHPNDTIQFDWGAGSCGYDPYPYGAPDFPEPYFDLMFFVEFPWVLDSQESKKCRNERNLKEYKVITAMAYRLAVILEKRKY